MEMKYSINSKLSNKVIAHKDSPIDGMGTFACDKISKYEEVFIKGGYILARSQMYTEKKIDSYWPISDDYVLAAKEKQDVERIKFYINHSCNPNCGIRGDIIGIAIRDIDIGEEITFDYAFLDNEDNRFKCACGSSNCRQIITGYDWQIKEIQDRYKEYFVAYLKDKIEKGFYYQALDNLKNEIKTLRNEVFVDELHFEPKDEFESDESSRIHCCLFVENEIVAYARVDIQDKNACISHVAVKKDKRNNGYGKQIMFWAETEALKRDSPEIEIHSLIGVSNFYRKLNYLQTGKEFLEKGKPHVLMTKHLTI